MSLKHALRIGACLSPLLLAVAASPVVANEDAPTEEGTETEGETEGETTPPADQDDAGADE